MREDIASELNPRWKPGLPLVGAGLVRPTGSGLPRENESLSDIAPQAQGGVLKLRSLASARERAETLKRTRTTTARFFAVLVFGRMKARVFR